MSDVKTLVARLKTVTEISKLSWGPVGWAPTGEPNEWRAKLGGNEYLLRLSEMHVLLDGHRNWRRVVSGQEQLAALVATVHLRGDKQGLTRKQVIRKLLEDLEKE